MVKTEDSGIDSENEWISVKSKSKTNKQNIIKSSEVIKNEQQHIKDWNRTYMTDGTSFMDKDPNSDEDENYITIIKVKQILQAKFAEFEEQRNIDQEKQNEINKKVEEELKINKQELIKVNTKVDYINSEIKQFGDYQIDQWAHNDFQCELLGMWAKKNNIDVGPSVEERKQKHIESQNDCSTATSTHQSK